MSKLELREIMYALIAIICATLLSGLVGFSLGYYYGSIR